MFSMFSNFSIKQVFKTVLAKNYEESDEKEGMVNVSCYVWPGDNSPLGNWGHSSIKTPNHYLSIWPRNSVKPINPVGKILPAKAMCNPNFQVDKISEATEFLGEEPSSSTPVHDDDFGGPGLARAYRRTSLEPVPKEPMDINLPMSKQEMLTVENNIVSLKQQIEKGELRYCGVDLFDKGCINCLLGIVKSLEGTRYSGLKWDKYMLPAQFADELQRRKDEVLGSENQAPSSNSTPGLRI